MQRYFTSEILSLNETFNVSTKDTHHMKNVMRMSVDNTFEMVDGNGDVYVCHIHHISDVITYMPTEMNNFNTELPIDITMFSPFLKGEKMDWMLQKMTELGVKKVLFYDADRTIVKLDEKKLKKRLERFKKIVKEASEQSKRNCIPSLNYIGKLNSKLFEEYETVFFAYEKNAMNKNQSFKSLIDKSGQSIAFIFGPEGGFTPLEAEQLSVYNSIHLGPRILRAETAPLYFLSAVSFALEQPTL